MDIDYPKNWISRSDKKDRLHCVAENTETGVCIGYVNKPDSFAVWFGNSITDNTYIFTELSTKEEAINSIIDVMNEGPTVDYVPSTGAIDW